MKTKYLATSIVGIVLAVALGCGSAYATGTQFSLRYSTDNGSTWTQIDDNAIGDLASSSAGVIYVSKSLLPFNVVVEAGQAGRDSSIRTTPFQISI